MFWLPFGFYRFRLLMFSRFWDRLNSPWKREAFKGARHRDIPASIVAGIITIIFVAAVIFLFFGSDIIRLYYLLS